MANGSIGRGCDCITKAVSGMEHLPRSDTLGNTSETPCDDDDDETRSLREDTVFGLAGT
jgi:hypothetical protein